MYLERVIQKILRAWQVKLYLCTISRDDRFWRESASKGSCTYPIYQRTRGDGRPRTQPYNCPHVNLVLRPRWGILIENVGNVPLQLPVSVSYLKAKLDVFISKTRQKFQSCGKRWNLLGHTSSFAALAKKLFATESFGTNAQVTQGGKLCPSGRNSMR